MEMILMNKAFRGDRLKELRLERGWPQDDTAFKLGITPATLSDLKLVSGNPTRQL